MDSGSQKYLFGIFINKKVSKPCIIKKISCPSKTKRNRPELISLSG